MRERTAKRDTLSSAMKDGHRWPNAAKALARIYSLTLAFFDVAFNENLLDSLGPIDRLRA